MKHLVLLWALLVPSGSAAAQAPRLAARHDSLTAPLAAASAPPDTIAALHRLFAAKRKKLLPILAGTVAADAAGVAIIGSTVEGGGLIDGRVIGQALTGILGLVAVGTEVLFYSTAYGSNKEQRAVAAFEAHQLPRHLRRQLKARYFQALPLAAPGRRLAGRGH